MGYLPLGGIFENMLQLMLCGLYFERILNKWLFSYRNNDDSCTHFRGFGGMFPKFFLEI